MPRIANWPLPAGPFQPLEVPALGSILSADRVVFLPALWLVRPEFLGVIEIVAAKA